MRKFFNWSLAVTVAFMAGCTAAPTSPSAAVSDISSERVVSYDGQGSLSTRSIDAESIAAATPPRPGQSSPLNLKGIVTSVDANQLTLTVSGKVIRVPASTKIVDALGSPLTFVDIAVGTHVHVTGRALTGASTATTVRVLDFAVTGTVSTLAGPCPTVRLTIDTQNVATTTTTAFQHGDCSKLANDMLVEVQGTLDAGLLTALKIVLPKDGAPKPIKYVRLKGVVSLTSRACPARIFTVAGKEVRASAATTFTGSRTCTAIVSGRTVDVTGVQETGYVRALRINILK